MSLVHIEDNLYASKYELDNFAYNEFLDALLAGGDSANYEIAKVQNRKWEELFRGYGVPSLENTYHCHPAFANYPVVNISQAGARMFCTYLSDKYNNCPSRKFKKVKFKLPTEAEWKSAARCGNERMAFPWGAGNSVRNKKGEYLANFRNIPQIFIKRDGQTIEIINNSPPKWNHNINRPKRIDAHFPYGFGLYNMSGNVAEMLKENGRTKGGSWNSTGYYLGIDAEDEFEGFTEPSPMIGFRYFMEAIER